MIQRKNQKSRQDLKSFFNAQEFGIIGLVIKLKLAINDKDGK